MTDVPDTFLIKRVKKKKKGTGISIREDNNNNTVAGLKGKTSGAKYTSSLHDEGKLFDPQDGARCMAQKKKVLFDV